jgi:hypothetical protein
VELAFTAAGLLKSQSVFISKRTFSPLTKSASVQLGARQAAERSDDILEPLASSSCRNVPHEEQERESCVQFVGRQFQGCYSSYAMDKEECEFI